MDFLRSPEATAELKQKQHSPPSSSSSSSVDPSDTTGEVIINKLQKDFKPRALEENCGVFGVIGRENASRVAFFGLYALNHRGQESAGIASMDKLGIHVHKGMGLVSQVFDEKDIDTLKGNSAIGHTRYSTAGGSKLAGAQPFVLETDLGQLAIAHNGQVAKQAALRKIVLGRGVGLFSNSDSEVIAQMLARPHQPEVASAFARIEGVRADIGASLKQPNVITVESKSSNTDTNVPVWACWLARIASFMKDCEGAYSLVALTKDALYGFRDPYGLRPLCIGQLQETDGTWSYHLTSESCALGTVGSDFIREVHPGEIVRLDKHGIRSWSPLREPSLLSIWQTSPNGTSLTKSSSSTSLIPLNPTFCVFEYVYFARPDSIMEGQLVHSARTRLGAQLAREAPVLNADIVSGVPDSSIAAAIGYANELKLPFSEVFCKNRYIGRTFIKPDDSLRKNAIQLKYNPLTHVLQGKKIVLVDDSLVRGNTLRQLVPLLRRGGATEVHIRISSPPIRHPCFYGVDIGSYDELIATHMNTVDAIREYIKADSLEYLTHDGMMEAVRAGIPKTDENGNPTAVGHCSACMTGDYPVEFDE